MNGTFVATAILWVAAASWGTSEVGVISGVAVNFSQGNRPLAGAPIVLRVAQQGAFVTVAETVTDEQGRFSFCDLPLAEGATYLAGANHQGVHYPGTRVRLSPRQPTVEVTLVAHDATTSPSPLISRRHEIEVRPGAEFLEVTETLLVDNPTSTTYIGKSHEGSSPVTLRISLPEGLDHVTFEREFHGRNFQIAGTELTTDIPWRPGQQELKFSYRLAADRGPLLVRVLDRPTEQATVRVVGSRTNRIACNLPKAAGSEMQLVEFKHVDAAQPLPAGYVIELRLASLPFGFNAYARIAAGAILFALVLGTFVGTGRRSSRALAPR